MATCIWILPLQGTSELDRRKTEIESRAKAMRDRLTGMVQATILASFPGSHAPECEHRSCAGVESLVFFVT